MISNTLQAACADQFLGLPTNIPALEELKKINQWVAWTYEDRGGPKPTKPPINPHTGQHASTSNPATWGTYEQAVKRAKEDGLPGVGLVLSDDDNFTEYDFDNCFTRAGRLKPWAFDVLSQGETYAEISPSGKGIRLFARGKIAKADTLDVASVEMYGHGRYMTVTGNRVEGALELDRACPPHEGCVPSSHQAARRDVEPH